MRFFSLGDLMVDVVARLDGPLVEGSDSPGTVSYLGGGSAANTAAWLALAGMPSTFIGVVGDDLPGRAQADALQRLGLDARLRVDHDRATGTCLVLVAPGGERTMVPDPGANLGLCESDVPVEEFAAGDHLHVSGYALLREGRDAALHAIEHARAHDMTVSVGAASSAPLVDYGPDRFLALLPSETLLFANEQEASALAETDAEPDPEKLAMSLADRAGCSLVVTTGSGRAAWTDGRATVTEPAGVLGENTLDTTGAGDGFAAGFLASRAQDRTVAESLRAAHDLAARVCRIAGGRPLTA